MVLPVHDIDLALGQEEVGNLVDRAQRLRQDGLDLQPRAGVETHHGPVIELDLAARAVRRLDHISRAERKIQDGVFRHFRAQAEDHGHGRPFAGIDVADVPEIKVPFFPHDLVLAGGRTGRQGHRNEHTEHCPYHLFPHRRPPRKVLTLR